MRWAQQFLKRTAAAKVAPKSGPISKTLRSTSEESQKMGNLMGPEYKFSYLTQHGGFYFIPNGAV